MYLALFFYASHFCFAFVASFYGYFFIPPPVLVLVYWLSLDSILEGQDTHSLALFIESMLAGFSRLEDDHSALRWVETRCHSSPKDGTSCIL